MQNDNDKFYAQNPSNKFLGVNISDFKQFSSATHFYDKDPIEVLNLPARVENALKMNGYETIEEFCSFIPEKLIKKRNFGSKTIDLLIQVREKVLPLLISSPIDTQDIKTDERTSDTKVKVDEEFDIPKDQLFDLLLEKAKDNRSKDIIKRRYGMGTGERQTLEEIGNDYKITRERVRQIQVKTIKKLRHPTTKGRLSIIALVDEMLMKNGMVITDEEVDNLLPSYFNNSQYDGSSIMDLLTDLGWVQSYYIGDITFYAPRNILPGVNISTLASEIYQVIKNSEGLVPIDMILNKFKVKYSNYSDNVNLTQLILRLCRLDPRIEEKLPNKLGLYSAHPSVKDWRNHIKDILNSEGSPLHFTEIAERVNLNLSLVGNKLDLRRVHSILIESEDFSHIGVRGTYGLTIWGFRKEMTPALVEECLERAGVPLHWRQIYNYVKKFKDTKEANILAILNSNKKYVKHGPGEYILNKSDNQ